MARAEDEGSSSAPPPLVAADEQPQGRLVAVLVGVDHYAEGQLCDLTCAVNDVESVANAVERAQPADLLDLTVLSSPTRRAGVALPTRQNVLEALGAASGAAAEQDTVLVFFAGHGAMVEGKPCLFPCDVDPGLEKVLTVEAAQDAFSSCACPRRVMLLDCCQTAASRQGEGAEAFAGAARAVQWRTGAPASDDFVESFQQSPRGWSLVLSCGPNEMSLEDPEWGSHGIFSHFLSVGLRGEGDLDGDGVVSLAELLQYVANHVRAHARAVIAEIAARSGEGAAMAARQRDQNPTLVWAGPVGVPLIRSLPEQRRGFQRSVLRLWWRCLTERLPYDLAVEGMVRYGVAFLYGLALALSALRFTLAATGQPWWGAAAGAGLVGGLLWLASFALAGAATRERWHSGGYVGPVLALAGQVAVMAALMAACSGTEGLAGPAVRLAVELFVLIALLVIFGYNALHYMLSLADLYQRRKFIVLRHAFLHLERRWIHADLPNSIAMVSAHPKLYQVVGLVGTVVVLTHAGLTLVGSSESGPMAVTLAWDAAVLVLIQWQVQWVAAAYRKLRGLFKPEE